LARRWYGYAVGMRVHVESDSISSAGRAVHDISLAALIGGNLFARVAMHPALSLVSDPRERGRVVNNAWQRYGVVNSLALAGVLAGWVPARFGEAQDALLSDRERTLARGKDLAMCAVAVTGVAAAVEGVRFARMESGGAIPLEDGSTPAPEAPEREAKAKRRLNVLGAAHLATTMALAGVNAALSQAGFRRPPKRRVLKRRY
jgi:hypothetical protein